MTENKANKYRNARAMILAGLTVKSACENSGINKTTYYRHLKENHTKVINIEDKISYMGFYYIAMFLLLSILAGIAIGYILWRLLI